MVQTRHHGDLGPDLGIISSSGAPAARAVYDNDDNNDNSLHLSRGPGGVISSGGELGCRKM